jgi:catechol 2,3-dioxygenase-like lactoylglutathione lyase family enzyme
MVFLLGMGNLTAQTPDSNPLQLSLHHATLSVADMDKEIAWFQRVLGFQVGEQFKMGTEAEVTHMTIPGYRIDLAWRKGSVKHEKAKGDLEQGWMHIVFKTPVIDADYNKLVAEQTDVKADRDAKSAITRLIVHDPEGNEIEIQP